MTTEPLDVADLVAEAGDEAFDGLPRQTDMGHLHLHVGDLDRASRFSWGTAVEVITGSDLVS